MRKTRIILTFVATLVAIFITCSAVFASNAIVDAKTYHHPAKFDNCMVIDGVDVSYWQYNIDWEKVKRQGIDYAFIRCGFTGLDSPFSMNRDSYFEQNYENARKAGVMVGVYYYSVATSLTEAQKEAQFVLDILNGRDLDLPVVFDYEFDGRIEKAYYSWPENTRQAKMTSNALAFMNYIEKNSNYKSMFYSYRNMMDATFSSNYKFNTELIDSKYKVWMAQYSTDNSYARPFEFWQYTSSGAVTGISGNTDCNFWYYDNDAEVTLPGTSSIKDASVTLSRTSYEYTKYKKQPIVTVNYGGVKLQKGVDYKVHYIKNVLAGTGYAMIQGIGNYSNTKLVPFEITQTDIADGGVVADISDRTYTGDAISPTVKVSYKNTTLKKNVDYTVSYSNNTDAGTATVTVTGKRNYYGTMKKTFKITKAEPKFTGYTSYKRTVSSPDWTINTKVDSGAKLSYKSGDTSIASVDQNGKVSLKGKAGVVYITVTSPSTKNYNSAEKQVKITVNPDEASAAVITTGANSYDKTTDDKTFSLNASTNSDGAMTFSSSDTSVAAVDASGNVTLMGKEGTATITIRTAATDKFSAGSKTVIVTVTKVSKPSNIVSGVENTTLKASSELGEGRITVKWSKSPGYRMDYYEVYKSTTGYFGETPYFTTKSGTATRYTNSKGLTDGTKYYYKVRGVRIVDGKTIYSKWSNTAYRTYRAPQVEEPEKPDPNEKLIMGVQNTTLIASSVGTEGSITINWVKSPGFKMDYYEIFRSTDRYSGYGELPIYTTKDGTKTSYKNTKGLVKGTRYYYMVRGVRVIDGVPYYTHWSNTAYRTAK